MPPKLSFSIFRYSNEIRSTTCDNFAAQNILLSFIEMLNHFDWNDEAGRRNVQSTVIHLLTKCPCEENQIKALIEISEKLIPKSSDRLQFFVDIVRGIVSPVDVDSNMLIATNEVDANTKVEVATLKMKLYELKEAETKYQETKDYDKLAEIKEQISLCNEELTNLITPVPPNQPVRVDIKCFSVPLIKFAFPLSDHINVETNCHEQFIKSPQSNVLLRVLENSVSSYSIHVSTVQSKLAHFSNSMNSFERKKLFS